MQSQTELQWNGERFLPELSGEIALEHLHRYALALPLIKGKRLLDIACGEGYGSNLMAGAADFVLGMDLDSEAVAHACSKYSKPNLEFRIGDCKSIPLEDDSFDVIVCFETLEHHQFHDEMLAEFSRVLAPNGFVLISTPDRRNYSDARQFINPFHVRELYAEEFYTLLRTYFPVVAFYAQRVVYGSLIIPLEGKQHFVTNTGDCNCISAHESLDAPMYLIAVASTRQQAGLPGSLFDGSGAWQAEQLALLNDLADTREALLRARLQLEVLHKSICWRLLSPLIWVWRRLKSFRRRCVGQDI